MGAPWIVTVAKAGALCTPRLSVTTSENVTVPEVLGTVTETLEVGAVVVTVGLVGESGVEVDTGVGMGIGIGVGIGVGIGIGPTIGVMGLMIGVTGLTIGVTAVSGRFSLLLSDGAICFSLLVSFFAVMAAPTSTCTR
jgi:hypothetical protein